MSRPFALTPAQTKALDGQRNIAVTASAGSGKTATLVERYLALLLAHPGLVPGQILAITFTQKAATEMRQRLAQRVRDALQNADDSAQRQRLSDLHEALPNARISTIHAFCAALLREYPIEGRVDPSFRLMEDIESSLLRHETVRIVMGEIAQQVPADPQRQALARLVNEWGRVYTENALDHMLSQAHLARRWCQLYSQSSPAQIIASWQQQIAQVQQPAIQSILANPTTLSLLAELTSLQPHSNQQKDTAAAKVAPVRNALETLQADPSPANAAAHLPALVLALTTAQGTPYKGNLGNKSNWDADALTAFRQALSQLGSHFSPHHRLMQLTLEQRDHRSADLLIALAQVYLPVDARYQQRKGSGLLLEFDELQEKARDLLYHDNGRLGAHIARHIRFIMVDEFQDTDPLQWELIRPLVSHQGQLERDKLFIVGDPKQSIYAFRNADVALFAQVKDAILQANQLHQNDQRPFYGAGEDNSQEQASLLDERLGDLVMAENFRTLQAPVDFVNFLFSQFMHADPAEPFQVEYAPLICQRPSTDKTNIDKTGSVEFLFTPVDENEEPTDSLFDAANLVASRIAQILADSDLRLEGNDGDRPIAPDDIAVLFRRRRFLPLFEQALRRYQVPFQVVGGLGFYQQQEIFDLANILRILHNPLNSVALLGALRSPYLGLSDNGLFTLAQTAGASLWEKLNQCPADHPDLDDQDRQALTQAINLLTAWQHLKDRVPLPTLVQQILQDTGAWGFLTATERGTQSSVNLDKFLRLVRSFTGGGFKPLGDFVAHLDLLIEREQREGEASLGSTGGAVQLMTVHASKGLEFPLVFVPDLDAALTTPESDAVLLDPAHGIGLSVLDPTADYHRSPAFLRRLIAEKRRRQNLAEVKRLFYVAATRARDHLFLAGRLRPDHLQKTDNFDQCKDMLGWLCTAFKLNQENIETGIKSFVQDGRDYSIAVRTKPSIAPNNPLTAQNVPPAYHTLSSKSATKPAAAPAGFLDAFLPFPAPTLPPQLAATQLVLYEQDPSAYRHLAGMDLESLSDFLNPNTIAPQRRGMLLGSLAHAALEALGHDPKQNDDAQIAHLLAETPLPYADLQNEIHPYLVELLSRFRNSPHSGPWLNDSTARLEQPFLLSLYQGTLAGVIDRIHCSADGYWHLIDYKTNRIDAVNLETEAARHKRQLEIYTLALQRLYPNQPFYEGTLYFTHIDALSTFRFSPEDLNKARREIGDLLAKIAALENTE
jgi:ATP-dependent helicase/nuclease subunit A